MTQVVEFEFDTAALRSELAKLSPKASEIFLERLSGDFDGLPFDLFVREYRPASDTGGTDKVLVGFRLDGQLELSSAA